MYPQAHTIVDNCGAQIFFKPNGTETAQMISNRLGRGRDLWSQDDWVLSPQEAMGPDYDGKQFIFLRGQKPILADLDLWHQRRLER